MRKIIVSIPSFEEFSCGEEICCLQGEDLQAVQAGEARLYTPAGEEILPGEWWASWFNAPGLNGYRFIPGRKYALFEQAGYIQAWRLEDEA